MHNNTQIDADIERRHELLDTMSDERKDEFFALVAEMPVDADLDALLEIVAGNDNEQIAQFVCATYTNQTPADC